MMTSSELEEVMAYCTGTEGYTKANQFTPKFLLTDGAVTFAKSAEAFWFIDEVAFNLLQKPFNFASVTLTVKKDKAKIVALGDNEEKIWAKNISFTDCPEGEWCFYVQKNVDLSPTQTNYIVMMYCSEY